MDLSGPNKNRNVLNGLSGPSWKVHRNRSNGPKWTKLDKIDQTGLKCYADVAQ